MYTADAPTAESSTNAARNWHFPSKIERLRTALDSAREEARQLTASQGLTSAAAAVAWEEVEELMSELAFERAHDRPLTGFERYIYENPDADEARIYDV
jgi:AcrR family transcriptional regulator